MNTVVTVAQKAASSSVARTGAKLLIATVVGVVAQRATEKTFDAIVTSHKNDNQEVA